MTNFEKYKDEICNIVLETGTSDFGKTDKLYKCGDLRCNDCIFYDLHNSCSQMRKNWLAQEYCDDESWVKLSISENYKYQLISIDEPENVCGGVGEVECDNFNHHYSIKCQRKYFRKASGVLIDYVTSILKRRITEFENRIEDFDKLKEVIKLK